MKKKVFKSVTIIVLCVLYGILAFCIGGVLVFNSMSKNQTYGDVYLPFYPTEVNEVKIEIDRKEQELQVKYVSEYKQIVEIYELIDNANVNTSKSCTGELQYSIKVDFKLEDGTDYLVEYISYGVKKSNLIYGGNTVFTTSDLGGLLD